jgi:Ribonuclease G/E
MNKHIEGPWQATEKFDREGNSFWLIETVRERDGWEIAEARCDVPNHGENAKVMAAAPELLGDLIEAAAILRKYEGYHRAKNTDESTAKAEVNAALAARFEATIAKARGEQC